jgi:hypothetical protein
MKAAQLKLEAVQLNIYYRMFKLFWNGNSFSIYVIKANHACFGLANQTTILFGKSVI